MSAAYEGLAAFGFVWTPVALIRNRKNMAKIRELAATATTT
jgi:hypothetical protein